MLTWRDLSLTLEMTCLRSSELLAAALTRRGQRVRKGTELVLFSSFAFFIRFVMMTSSMQPSLIELLQQAQKELRCPTCGRSFLLSEIRCRGHINNSVMLQAICSDNHFPTVLIFIPSKPFPHQIKPISKRDITQFKEHLATFDGEFSKLWR